MLRKIYFGSYDMLNIKFINNQQKQPYVKSPGFVLSGHSVWKFSSTRDFLDMFEVKVIYVSIVSLPMIYFELSRMIEQILPTYCTSEVSARVICQLHQLADHLRYAKSSGLESCSGQFILTRMISLSFEVNIKVRCSKLCKADSVRDGNLSNSVKLSRPFESIDSKI